MHKQVDFPLKSDAFTGGPHCEWRSMRSRPSEKKNNHIAKLSVVTKEAGIWFDLEIRIISVYVEVHRLSFTRSTDQCVVVARPQR